MRHSKSFALLCAVAVSGALTAFAWASDDQAAQQEALRQAALTQLPAPAPGPAFPGAETFDMPQFCPRATRTRGRGVNRRSPPLLPPEAVMRRINGAVVLDCTIGADGKAATCEVVYEAPADIGFARSAATIACYFEFDLSSLREGEPILVSGGALPAGTRVYRRSGEGEPWRTRTPLSFRIQ